MNFLSPFNWFGKLLTGERKAEKLQMLQQQHRLLLYGLEASAEVLEAFTSEDKVGSMFPVRLWLKLKRMDGSYIYTHTQTLVPFAHIPGKGQHLRIKYFPENLSDVLIL